jgi:hypothetical protein
VESAMQDLKEKISDIFPSDLAVDLMPMFESRAFIESWLETFHANIERYTFGYITR